jgi:NAD+ synthase
MDWTQSALDFDTQQSVNEISDLIKDNFQRLNRKIAVLGLSGGLDSSLTASLAVHSLGKDRVKAYYLPEIDSKPIHREHALILSNHLGIYLNIVKISTALRKLGIYRLLPLRFIPGRILKRKAVEYGKREFLSQTNGEFLSIRLASSGGSWVARGNAYVSAKHRLRMVLLYKEAERLRGLVIGAANKTEWMTGTFTQWGCDHCGDVMPILHLYRSQLEVLAEYLHLPAEILHKKADPDILPGLTDKGDLLGSFEEADQILWGLENQIPDTDLKKHFDKDRVEYIKTLVKNSTYYRETPYSLLNKS